MGKLLFLLISLSLSTPLRQPQSNGSGQPDLPRIFQLSDSEIWLTELEADFSMSLLKACQNDPQVAFQHWRPFTQRIQQLTREHGLHQPGLQLWVKAFWNKDGSLAHIGYATRNELHPRLPDQWQSLFEQLIRDHHLTGSWDAGFYHLGSIKMH